MPSLFPVLLLPLPKDFWNSRPCSSTQSQPPLSRTTPPAWGTISNLSLPLYILQVGAFPCKLHMPHPCLKHLRGFQLHSEDQPLLPSTGPARTWLSLHAPLPEPCLSSPPQTSCLLSPKCSTPPPASGTQLPVLTWPDSSPQLFAQLASVHFPGPA